MIFELLRERWRAGKVVSPIHPIERLRVGANVLGLEAAARRYPRPERKSSIDQSK